MPNWCRGSLCHRVQVGERLRQQGLGKGGGSGEAGAVGLRTHSEAARARRRGSSSKGWKKGMGRGRKRKGRREEEARADILSRETPPPPAQRSSDFEKIPRNGFTFRRFSDARICEKLAKHDSDPPLRAACLRLDAHSLRRRRNAAFDRVSTKKGNTKCCFRLEHVWREIERDR